MDIRKRVFASMAITDATGVIGIDIGELLRHLLLFENVTIKSAGVRDLGYLAKELGLDAALAIVGANGVKVHWDPATICRRDEPRFVRAAPGRIALHGLDIGVIRIDVDRYLPAAFAEAAGIAALTPGRARKFEMLFAASYCRGT